MEGQERGELTERVKMKSMILLGYEVTREELRFLSYLNFVLTNDHWIESKKLTKIEKEILSKYENKGYLKIIDKQEDRFYTNPASPEFGLNSIVRISYKLKITCTELFWMALSELLYLSHVDIN